MSRSITVKRNMTGEIAVTAVLMGVAAVVIVLVLVFQRKVDSSRLENGAYNYFGSRRIEYEKSNLQYKDGNVYLKDSEGEKLLDTTPLYEDKNHIVVPYSYLWYDIASDRICRLEHFSEVKNEENSILLEDGELNTEKARGFLYDGVDTYIFLEKADLLVGEESISLPPMSYVVVKYGDTIQYYLGGTDTSSVLDIGEESCKAVFSNGDTLELTTDILSKANGVWHLLAVNPQAFDRMR